MAKSANRKHLEKALGTATTDAIYGAAREVVPTAGPTPRTPEVETPVPSGTYVGEIVGTEKIGSK